MCGEGGCMVVWCEWEEHVGGVVCGEGGCVGGWCEWEEHVGGVVWGVGGACGRVVCGCGKVV